MEKINKYVNVPNFKESQDVEWKKLVTHLTPTSWKFNLFKLKSEKKTFYQNLSVVWEKNVTLWERIK